MITGIFVRFKGFVRKRKKAFLASCMTLALSSAMAVPCFAAETTPTTMDSFLTQIGTFFTQSVSWLTSVLNTIVSNPPLLVLCIAMPVIGFAVGLLGRLIRL